MFGIATVGDTPTALLTTYYEAGLAFRGALAARPDDVINLGWSELDINPRVARREIALGQPPQHSDSIVELNYQAQATRWMLVRPSVQYSIDPGAVIGRRDAVVAGCHVQMSF